MLPILVIAGLLAVVWAAIFVRELGLFAGCLAVLLSGSCFGYFFYHTSVVSSDRLLFAVLALAYAATLGTRLFDPRKITRTDLAVILFLLVVLYSTLSHNWKLAGAQPLATFLFFYLMPASMYWFAVHTNIGERQHRCMLGFFAVLGLYLAITAVLESKGFHSLVFPRYIVSTEHIEFFGRGRGPFLNPVGNGLYLSAGLISALLLWPFVPKPHRPLIGILSVVLLGGIYYTLTRSVWLGAGGILFVLAVLTVPPKFSGRVALIFVMLAAGVLAAKWSSLQKFKRDQNVSTADMAESALLRPILAAYAFEMFKDHPITGVGFGQYTQNRFDYVTRRGLGLPMEKAKQYVQHNVFLAVLAEMGLMGLTPFMAMLGLWSINGWKLWRDRARPLWMRQQGMFTLLLLTSYLPNAMFHDLTLIPMLNMLIFFQAGLSAGLVRRTDFAAAGMSYADSAIPQSGWAAAIGNDRLPASVG